MIPALYDAELSWPVMRRTQLPPMMDLQSSRVYNSSSDRRDIIVFFHMQKTGGKTFLSYLVTASAAVSIHRQEKIPLCSLQSKSYFNIPCLLEKQNTTQQEQWLASERTYGWTMCGVHPFLPEMKSCLNNKLNEEYGKKNRHFHYSTMLRNPVFRYVSEYYHIVRGASWNVKGRPHSCNNQPVSRYVPPCYDGYYTGKMWDNLTFDKFMHCSFNWANNRQTIMLANLSSVDCLNPKSNMSHSERDTLLLESAKTNLMEMSFFGLTDYLAESCLLFERQFNVKFGKSCNQTKNDAVNGGFLIDEILFNETLRNIVERVNHLDIQLYDFALQVFIRRLEDYNIQWNH